MGKSGSRSTRDNGTSSKKKGLKSKKSLTGLGKTQFNVGDEFEGSFKYKIMAIIQKANKPMQYDVYEVKNEDNETWRLKIGRNDSNGSLKREATALKKMEKTCGDKVFPSIREYGTICGKNRTEYIVISPMGVNLQEMLIKMNKFSMDCVLTIAVLTLKAIQDMHKAGFIHRLIRPAAFHVGMNEAEGMIFMQDFRQARTYLLPNKAHMGPKTRTTFFGVRRFASRQSLLRHDQSRRDDLESWLYMIFNFLDPDTIKWKGDCDLKSVAATKETFMRNNQDNMYNVVPSEMRELVDHVCKLEFEEEPNYSLFHNALHAIRTANNFQQNNLDWKGQVKSDAPNMAESAYSADLQIAGEIDNKSESRRGKAKKKKSRHKLSPGDIIRNTSGGSEWKVINLLGCGGFGDVYKVHRSKEPADKCYALKTESEDGDKRYLRLKVEVTVMMKTAEFKKEKGFDHFIDFVDRGKCELLKCKYVVMGLVGPSIEDIRTKYMVSSFNRNTCFNVAIQTVQAVSDLHSLGYLHRDIKPANYAVGLNEYESVVYMLDFGIAKLYLDQNGNHKAPRKKVKFLGTLRYAARACMKQIEQGRKDDLECWIYMVFDLFDEFSALSWKRVADPKKILLLKERFFQCESDMFKRVPKSMANLVRYIDELNYESTPDYKYIKKFLRTCASDVGARPDKKLEWIGKLKKKALDVSDSEKTDEKEADSDTRSK